MKISATRPPIAASRTEANYRSSLRAVAIGLCTLALALAPGCGGGSSDSDQQEQPSAPDGGAQGSTPDGGQVSGNLDKGDCVGVAASMVEANNTCGSPLPGGAQAALQQMCEKGIDAAEMCGGDPAAGLTCFETYEAADWQCTFGEAYPSCNGDLPAALGMYCLIALGNPSCASGLSCDFDVDCPNGAACNSATGQCFDQSAYCVGLPCEYDVDCPQGEKCNSAEGACIL